MRKAKNNSSTGIRRRGSKSTVDPSYTKAHSKKSVKYMSDSELREVNNRLIAERNYTQMTKTKSKGKKVVDAFCSTATTLAAVTAAYGTYKKILGPKIQKLITEMG